MPDYKILKQLLPELEAFQAEKGFQPSDLHELSVWLSSRWPEQQQQGPQPLSEKLDWNGKGRGGKPHYTASNLLTALGRYKMNYVRMALEGTSFDTYDEFAFVLSLVFAGPYTQSQLIERHVQLKPTGMEVIRRLLKRGLIEQIPSATDKRSKLLHATDSGRKAFHATLSRINAVTDMVMAPLNDQERLSLLQLLQKLDQPHREIFMHERKLGLNGLMEKFGLTNGQ